MNTYYFFSGIIKEETTDTAKTPATINKEKLTGMVKISDSSSIIFMPIKTRMTDKPYLRKRNKCMLPLMAKYKERNPSIAKILDE